jgi:YfiR/HmsC-like
MDTRNLLGVLLLGLLFSRTALAESIPEYQLKSAFIYNFATFIDWPDSIGKTLKLCVAGPRTVVDSFKSLEGKPVGNAIIEVRHLEPGSSPVGCEILFAVEAESAAFDVWLPKLAGSQALTVTESGQWVKKGVMIGLLLEGKRVVFEVNADAAKNASLNINSKLMRLAHKVYGAEHDDDSKK